ncbi:hypothetical protein AABB24_023359 [Solanum stoloniferum]|uniref:ADF-H domain-containing protein n=1 Tax=Solanum stoloniferum TaxID=62892 RepID=A0ABD2T567_9SOLN
MINQILFKTPPLNLFSPILFSTFLHLQENKTSNFLSNLLASFTMAMAFKMATTGMWVTDECKNSYMDMKWKKNHRSPTESRIRAKILYATSKAGLRRVLDGISYELQATDPTEMGMDVIKDRAK